MRIVFSLVLLFCQFILSSQQSGFIFIENKGQWHHDVLFKTDLKNGHLYATKNGFVYDFYDENKLRFENLASIVTEHLIKKSAKNYKAGWITKGSGDSGIDFIGRMDIGTGFGSAKVIVLGQAKCESLNSPTGGNHIARTVAKLKRGWLGVYVTTSYFSDNVQIEILEDKYPLLLINGKKLAELVNEIVFDQGYKNVAEYLKKVDSEYEGLIQYRDPEEILFE